MNINNRKAPEFGHLADVLYNMSANEVAIYGSIIGFIIGQDMTQQEQGSLGNFLMLVAQVLVSMGAQNNLVSARKEQRTNDINRWNHP